MEALKPGESRREACVRFRGEGKTLREIGKLLGISHQAVGKNLKAHARGYPVAKVAGGQPETPLQLTRVDKAILEAWDPKKTKHQNLLALQEKGVTSVNYGYERFKQAGSDLNDLVTDLTSRFYRRITPKSAALLESRLKQAIDGEIVLPGEISYIKEGLRPLSQKDQPASGNTIIQMFTQMFGARETDWGEK